MATGARSLVRIRRIKRDRLDPTPPGPEDRLEIRGLIILPQESYEEGQGWVTHEGLDVFTLPSSTAGTPPRRVVDGDILASDQVQLDNGEIWKIDGPPAAYDKGRMRRATRFRISRVGLA